MHHPERFETRLVQTTMAKFPVESITREEAKLRHPEGDIEVMSIHDHDGEPRLALYVFRKNDTSSERMPYAVYWLDRNG
jgi:hypothetical protein